MVQALARLKTFVRLGVISATLSFVGFAQLSPQLVLAGDLPSILANLPASERDHVVVLNRNGSVARTIDRTLPAPGHLVVAMRQSNVAENTFVEPSGRQFVATLEGRKPVNAPQSVSSEPPQPASTIDPLAMPSPGAIVAPGTQVLKQWQAPFDIRTGALHGVRSKNGFSAERATVSIPCGASRMLALPGTNPITNQPGLVDKETGYIYIGGWGAGPMGAALDAGLQKSSAQNPADDYSAYWKYDGNAPITFSRRFPCGSRAVSLVLYPLSRTMLHFSATGVDETGAPLTFTVLQSTNNQDGWWPNGGSADDGIILKRMVTIAQPTSWHTPGSPDFRPDAWHHKAWFGVAETDFRPMISWSDCMIGNSSESGTPTFSHWTSAQTWTSASAILDYPFGSVQRATVASSCDVIGIDLEKTQF